MSRVAQATETEKLKVIMLEDHTRIPLFPLNKVLFPGMILPLHIFEDRYKAMINYCLAHDNLFGVVLAKNKQAVASNVSNLFSEDIYNIGTIAHIAAVENLNDKRMNLITVGQDRFVINTIHASADDYLIGEVNPYPFKGVNNKEVKNQMSRRLMLIMRTYISNLEIASGEDLSDAKLPNDPEALAFLAGNAVKDALADKQQLLTAQSLADLVSRAARLIDKENKILAYMIKAHRAHQQVQQLPFVDYSLN